MAGYLEQYGAGEDRRQNIFKIVALALVGVLVVGGILFWFLKNFRQEKQVRQFFELLSRQDFKAAYALWGCTEEKPCRDYRFEEFLKDWGAQSPHAGPWKIVKSRSCGSGVIVTVDAGKTQDEKLWVQRDDLTIGFSPLPGCPPGR